MFTFPASYRVRQKATFDEIFADGVKTVTRELVIIKRTGVSGPKIGIIVSKKVGNAVTRNRIKRQVREAFRNLRPSLVANPKTASLELVVIGRQFAKDADSTAIAKSLAKACLS